MSTTYRCVSLLLVSGLALLFAGCGSSPAANSSSTPFPATALDGNWLIGVGTTAPTPLSSPFINLSVTGDSVAGFVTVPVTCGNTTYNDLSAISGSVSNSGTLTLQSTTATTNQVTFTLQGATPTTSGAAWTGSYTYNTSQGGCSGAGTSAISVAAMPLLSGTFTGTGTLQVVGTTAQPAATIQMALTQGNTTTLNGTTLPFYEVEAGTMTVQGSSCLTTGTMSSSTTNGFVTGNTVNLYFTMNDGSILFFIGSIINSTSSQLYGTLTTTKTGSCNLGTTFNTIVGAPTFTK
jgi:hypothetical protein